MALKIEEINQVLTEIGVNLETRQKAIKAAEEFEANLKEERAENKGPKSKNKFVIVVRGDEKVKAAVQAGWVVQMKESADESTLISRITEAARESNRNQKRKKQFLNNYRDFFAFCKRAFTKTASVDVQIKTKHAVQVVVLPTEDIKFD